ncbi:hypothetical protein GWK08_12810 [Leptobacterium flavescens]|uniref:Uncharacterized protein n=1 Tax=Leptobacterium flavescens TaxID=472055 RepID=A0A6P0UVA0_9FLAO|nr:hypothetical protein [Leptobacterium flavescens]NER14326.1 hypothetical protein [Leptobacterium flavescens]
MKSSSVQTIDKEQIKFLNFPHEEVLASKKDQHNRCLDIKRAMSLGNLEHQKVRILFVDNEGFKKVETTIWGVTDRAVILKQSTIIPLERILYVY